MGAILAAIALRIRSGLRALIGRPGVCWAFVRSPMLPFRVFPDRVDCILYALTLSLPRVFFIQVGSNDGVSGDPLRAFLGHGRWGGIMIEPIPYVFRRLAARYGQMPGLALENVAIADRCGTCDFHYIEESPDLGSGYEQLGSLYPEIVREHAEAIGGLADRIVTARVDCMTFQALCDKHQVDHINVIHVDAEGHDYEVLRQIDLRRYRPAVVIYEHILLSETDRLAVWDLLRASGYDLLKIGQDTVATSGAARTAHPKLDVAWKVISAATSGAHIAAGPGTIPRARR